VALSAAPVEVGGIAVEESGPGRDAITHFFRATQPAQMLFRRVGVAILDRLGLGDAVRRLRARLGGRRGTTVTRAETDNRSR
jgi:hypothetical protein